MASDATGRLEVVELDAAKVHTPAGNRKVTTDAVAGLLPSIEKDGQLIAGIVYPHPTLPDTWLCADGNHRLLACRMLGRPFKAVVLPGAPTEEELIRIRVTANFHRKNATAYELAVDIERWMQVKEANQKQAAAFFGISEAQVSKILCKARNAVPEVVQAERDRKICEDVGRLLATLPRDRQVEALLHVIAKDLKRDAVERYVAEMKGLKRPKEGPAVSVSEDGATIKLPATWSWQKVLDLAAKLQDAAKKGMKVEGLTISALPSLLRP